MQHETAVSVKINQSKLVLSGYSKEDQILVQDRLSLMQVKEHSEILSTFVELPFVFKTNFFSIFEWPLKTGFTVLMSHGVTPLKWYLQHLLLKIRKKIIWKFTFSMYHVHCLNLF